jgi:hypothetical protein
MENEPHGPAMVGALAGRPPTSDTDMVTRLDNAYSAYVEAMATLQARLMPILRETEDAKIASEVPYAAPRSELEGRVTNIERIAGDVRSLTDRLVL